MKLWSYLREKMLRYPQQQLCEENMSMNYEEVVVFAERFAEKFAGETCCAIYCQSEMRAALSLLACFAAGVTAVPVSPRYGRKYCEKILHTIYPPCMITDAGGELDICQMCDSAYDVPKQHPAMIMFTSGTTGTPKGVMLTEENVLTNVRDICSYFGLDNEDTLLIARPLYHCAVLTGEFLTGLIQGCRIVFHSKAFNPSEIISVMIHENVTVFCSTPTLMELLCRFMGERNRQQLKKIAISGECMSEAVGKRIRLAFPETDIYHVYGLTEACPRVAYMPPHHFDKAPDFVGLPLPSMRIEIRNKDGRVMPMNQDGLLWVYGNNIMAGYYNAPEQTERVLKKGWLCTGDIACQNERGWLKIKGRADDLIIRAGMNIYPQEVEMELKKDPRAQEVLAYGYSDQRGNTQIGLKVVGDFKNEDEVRMLCSKLLPPFQMPSKIELKAELPKNESGKVVRRN